MSVKQVSFLGLGDMYLGPSDGTGAMESVGSCSQVQFGIDEDEKSQPNFGRAGGVLNSVTRISAVNLGITMQNLNPANLARALRGTSTAVSAGTVSEEVVTAYKDGLIRLAHTDATSVVVKDATDTTTYTEGTDYKVSPAGLFIPSTSSIFSSTDGVTVHVNYSYGARSVVEALVNSASEYTLAFDGLNEADSGKSCVIDAWRVKFGLPSALDVVGDDYISLQLAGKLLADNTKGTGKSAFFRWNYAG